VSGEWPEGGSAGASPSQGAAGCLEEEGSLPGSPWLHKYSVRPPQGVSTWAYLGVLHGYGEHIGRHRHFMRWMAERGVACYGLDFRGQGRSGGRRGFVGRWDEYLDDLRRFLSVEALRVERREGLPLFVLGHSHGGLVLAAAALEPLPGVDGCIFTAPYFRSRMHVPAPKVWVARVLDPIAPWMPVPSGLRDEWMSRDEAMVRDSREDPLRVRVATPRWYFESRRWQETVLRRAAEFRLPALILIGDADPVSDPRATHEFYERAGSEDKTFRIYPDRLHELLRDAGREEVFTQILEWMRDRTAG